MCCSRVFAVRDNFASLGKELHMPLLYICRDKASAKYGAIAPRAQRPGRDLSEWDCLVLGLLDPFPGRLPPPSPLLGDCCLGGERLSCLLLGLPCPLWPCGGGGLVDFAAVSE